jgi:3'-phosphoadenosine 5'-phosphosulfate sulfotransferase (PAPS reductase)/FAD synthetase
MSSISEKTEIALARISKAIEKTKPIAVFGLFSGGHDSVTATTIASLHPRFTSAVHINTGIGINRTREYVRETAALKGWKLSEYEAQKNVNGKGKPDPQIYRDLVIRLGFPGPHGHGMMYSRLKERCLRMLQREWGAKSRKKSPRRVMYISGCRSEESFRRMANTKEVQIDGQQIWCAPIHDWTKKDCDALMLEHQIPRNPIVDLINKSGECLCGAFVKKGELEELSKHPETRDAYEEIMSIQADVIAAGKPWGWEDSPPDWYQEKKKGQCFLLEYDQHLCWSCNKSHEALKAALK